MMIYFLAGLCSMLLLLKSFPSMYSSVTHVFCEQAESFRRIYFTPLVKLLHLQLLHVRRLPEATPAHSALRLAVDARTGGKPDIRPEWKRQQGRPCRTWVQQIEGDTGLNTNDAWRIAHDRKSWRALRPVAGQAFH